MSDLKKLKEEFVSKLREKLNLSEINQIKSDLKDLNQKLGIEIKIPDPLKRDNRRRIAQPIRSNYGRNYAGRTKSYRTNSYKRDVPARDQYKRKGSK